MTKKDYEMLAGVFRAAFRESQESDAIECRVHAVEILDFTIDAISEELQADNPRFDRSRFLAACRGEDSHDSAGRRVRYSRRSA